MGEKKAEWLIDGLMPLGHKCMDVSPEGSFKTTFGAWLSVCIASGTPVFGRQVTQGGVIIEDEETPPDSLQRILNRFAMGLGYELDDLPIYVSSMVGFRFNRRSEMKKLLKKVDFIEPVFIRMDSMISMLPGGRESLSENDSSIGVVLKDDLNTLIQGRSLSSMLAVHSKKFIGTTPVQEVAAMPIQTIARGHGSIIGEGCDTGYLTILVSEAPPTRFCLVTKPRRSPAPDRLNMLIELKEERYREGWARLEEVSFEKLPPSSHAKEIFKLFTVPDGRGSYNHSSSWIARTCAFLTKWECRESIEELLVRKAIVESGPQNYKENPSMWVDCSAEYIIDLVGK